MTTTEVLRHPDIDLAVIRVSLAGDTAPSGLEDQYLRPPEGILLVGGDFVGAGYPLDEQPVERVLKGHFQRHFTYKPPSGHGYWAGEMSVPAPGGLSGGVLSYEARPHEAAAIVTANMETSITVDSYEEVHRGNITYKETIKRVVSYGISLMLSPHREWLAASAG